MEFRMPVRRFSERRGIKPVSDVIQVDGMNRELRNSLWNVLSSNFMLDYKDTDQYSYSVMHNGILVDRLVGYLWINFFKEPLERMPTDPPEKARYVLKRFFQFEWDEVYDFLEVVLNFFESSVLVNEINSVLERELAGYRFVGGVFTDITGEQEIEMLEQAVVDTDFPHVAEHLKRALALMSDRENPDYRNSIKESISAVESLAKVITGKPKASLGEALKTLENSGQLHPALKTSFLSLYGYTSDENGIRHAMLEEPSLTATDAKFFLLSCTSFINYLKSKI